MVAAQPLPTEMRRILGACSASSLWHLGHSTYGQAATSIVVMSVVSSCNTWGGIAHMWFVLANLAMFWFFWEGISCMGVQPLVDGTHPLAS